MTRRLPSERILNATLTESVGEDVIKFEVLDVEPGDTARITFHRTGGAWRQGIFLATEGSLVIAGQPTAKAVLWSDMSPQDVEVLVERTDGLLRIYNVWDAGRSIDSQSASSGMLKQLRADGSVEYRCADVGLPPDFSKLVFVISMGSARS